MTKAPPGMAIGFRLVDAGWDKLLDSALRADRSSVRIVSRFIKKNAAERILKHRRPKALLVITRYNLDDFCEGVSDIAALRFLLDNGAHIRGVRNLHAKMYLFGATRTIVTSANLTDAALLRNHEFGFVAEDSKIIGRCREYFDDMWERAGNDLTAAQLAAWDGVVRRALLADRTREARALGLGDQGAHLGVSTDLIEFPGWFGESEQAFVKFFGEGANRAERSVSILEQVRGSGCHWACTYHKGKRPRQVEDGAVLFMGFLVGSPNDVLIFGRAVGMHHVPVRDDASKADIKLSSWKAKWPHYIRVHHGEFISGNLSDGVSLNELMNALGSVPLHPRRGMLRTEWVTLTRGGPIDKKPQWSLRLKAFSG